MLIFIAGHQQFILTAVVRHLDHKNVSYDPRIKSDIIQTATALARQIRSSIVLSDIGFVNDLCRHMRKSLQASVDSVGEHELNLNTVLQNSIEDCLLETARGVYNYTPLHFIHHNMLYNILPCDSKYLFLISVSDCWCATIIWHDGNKSGESSDYQGLCKGNNSISNGCCGYDIISNLKITAGKISCRGTWNWFDKKTSESNTCWSCLL